MPPQSTPENDKADRCSAPPATIHVDRAGQCIIFSRPDIEVVPCMVSVRHFAVRDAEHGYRIDKRPQSLFSNTQDYWGDDVLAVPAGSAPVVVEALRRSGHRVEGDIEVEPLPPPHRDRLDSLEQVDEQMLEFVAANERGIIQYRPRRVSPAKLIAEIAHAWPTHSIVVLATRIKDVRRLARGIGRHIPLVGRYSSRHPDTYDKSRVVVCTYRHAAATAVDIRHRQIVIAVDPLELLTRQDGREALGHAWRARCYGLLAEGTHLARLDRDHLLAVFGPARIWIPAHGRVPEPPNVVFCPIQGGPRLSRQLDALDLKRQGIWTHPVRNRRIVQLARALAGGDRAALRRCFPAVGAAVNNRRPRRVGILVEGIEHALLLSTRLGWPIIARPEPHSGGLAEADATRLESSIVCEPIGEHSIVTHGGLDHAGRFSVLIRADGGQDYHARMVKSARLVVDFTDRHHPLLRQWSRQRREFYAAGDWAAAPLGNPEATSDT